MKQDEMIYGGVVMRHAPHISVRNGNNQTDLDLRSMHVEHTHAAFVARIDLDKYGQNAPMLPVVVSHNNVAYGPWRYEKATCTHTCLKYVHLIGKVWVGLVRMPEKDISPEEVALEQIGLRVSIDRIRQFRKNGGRTFQDLYHAIMSFKSH